MKRWLALAATFAALAAGAASACGNSPATPDASVDDAALDKKVPPEASSDADASFVGPTKLSETGLYSDFASRTLAAGIIAFEPRWPLWSDGLEKKRYLLLPPSTKIDTSAMDDWAFPIGTKVWKEFDLGDAGALETRLLWKISDSEWFEIAYAWTSDGSDALAEPDGGVNALGTFHDIPSQTDCNACHANVRDVLIGVSALQLGASDGDGTLAKLADAGLLTNPPSTPYDVPGTGATKDALGYLHGNCGHCHNSDYADPKLQQQTPMRLRLLVSNVTPESAAVYSTATCLVMKHTLPPDNLIYALVPGDPDASGIPNRMGRRDSYEMPPNCTELVDDAGVATVRAWIASMDAATCGDAASD
jgi:hypothetical protein